MRADAPPHAEEAVEVVWESGWMLPWGGVLGMSNRRRPRGQDLRQEWRDYIFLLA